jgi:hypothetical protein
MADLGIGNAIDKKERTMNCSKHPRVQATRFLSVGGSEYGLCAECAEHALKAGEVLLCPDGRSVRLNKNGEPVFRKPKKIN